MKRFKEIVFSLTEPTDKEVIWIYPIKDVNNPKENDLIDYNGDELEGFDKNLYSVKIYNNAGWEDLYSGNLHYIKQQLLRELGFLDERTEVLETFIGEIGENDTLEKRFELVTGDSEETIASLDTKIQTLQGDSQQTIATLDSALQVLTETVAQNTLDIAGKQDAETGKDLSSNDFTDELLAQLTNLGHFVAYKGVTTSLPTTGQTHGDLWILHDTSEDTYVGYIWNAEYVTPDWDSIGDCTTLVDVYTKTETNAKILQEIGNWANSSQGLQRKLPQVTATQSNELNGTLWAPIFFTNDTPVSYPYPLDVVRRHAFMKDVLNFFTNPTTSQSDSDHYETVSLRLGGHYTNDNIDIDGAIDLYNKENGCFQTLKANTNGVSTYLATIPSTVTQEYSVQNSEGFVNGDVVTVSLNGTVISSQVAVMVTSNQYKAPFYSNGTQNGWIYYNSSTEVLSINVSPGTMASCVITKEVISSSKLFYLPSGDSAGDSNVLATTAKATTTKDGLLSKEDKAAIDNINTTIETQVNIKVQQATANIGGTVPVGGIIMWSGTVPPQNWALCDGQNGTPDLRGRFIIGAVSTSVNPSASVSVDGYTVTTPVNPTSGKKDYIYLNGIETKGNYKTAHAHTINRKTDTYKAGNKLSDNYNDNFINNTTLNNLPPFYVLAFIMRVS